MGSSEVHGFFDGLQDERSHVIMWARFPMRGSAPAWMRATESPSMCVLGMFVQCCIPCPPLSRDLSYSCRLARPRLRWKLVPEIRLLGVGSRSIGAHFARTSGRT